MGLSPRVIGASLLLALFVGLPFALLIDAVRELRTAAELSARGEGVKAAAAELETLLIDVETGQRGFVITGDEEYLEPWFAARERLPEELAQLRALVREPEQRRRADAIEQGLRSYLEDYAAPLVAQARESREAAATTTATGEGRQRVNALRAQFDEFEQAQEAVSAERAERVARDADRAIRLGIGGLAGSALLVLLFGAYLARAVVLPLRRTADSAKRLAGGDLGARTARGGPGEVDELAASFNEMAAALERGRDELEARRTELEGRQVELQGALAELGTEQQRLHELYVFAERIAERTEVEGLAEAILRQVCDAGGAEAGTLYAVDETAGEGPSLSAVRGLDAASLPRQLDGISGLAGRALAERRPVVAAPGESAARVASLGRQLEIRHELHLPLLHADRALGVVSIGRAADREFAPAEIDLLENLARQAGVALANAVSYRTARRVAQINRAVIDATADGILMVDLEGQTVLTNEAMAAMAAAVLGPQREGTIWEQTAEHADTTADPVGYRAAMDAIREDPEREALDEYRIADSGRWFQRYTSPVRDPDGHLIGRIFVFRDITPEREAEQLKSDLVATVSHELRTPLASIVGFSELLTRPGLEPETGRRYLGTIHSEARRLTSLINDFLDLQRIEAGGLRVELEALEVAPLLRQTVQLYSAQSTRHTIELDVPAEPLIVLADAGRIAQVVGNLVSNAIKYSPDGGTVRIRAHALAGAVRVTVDDEGLGIPAAQQSQIFEKFFRVDTSDTREIGGTGLGLALSREIVEAHGGRMGFESVEGHGSTFWIELPSGGARSGRGRVLVIADDREASTRLTGWLAEDGHTTELAPSGAAGLAAAERDPPALICLDVGLSGTPDGWDVLEALKSNPSTSSIPVVVCTADNGRHRAAALGAADVLAKPFSAEQLRETITRVLPSGGGSVLVVDDDPAVRRLVVETLALEGIHLREAADGTEALDAVASELPDAIVLDLVMPGLDGFAVLAELHRDRRARNVPVIVLTGKQLSPDERTQLKQRAVSLMEKNAYSAPELRGLIRAALGVAA